MAKKILVVDDEKDIISLLKFNLQAEGYKTVSAMDGDQALVLTEEEKPDLVLLDIMLPDKDGWEVLRELRQNSKTENIPIIFLTAKDSEFDEVLGLELGADDYIVKPISMRKLLARIKKVLKKGTSGVGKEENVIRIGDLEIYPGSYSVKISGIPITLTKKEFNIITFLAKRKGRVITRDILLNEIWGEQVVVVDRTVDVHIRNIREKFGPKHENLIETIKGVGYRIRNET
ncbi:MAG: response regulator transcription factor [Calditrichaeota bacterium]|nr:response regulator transcription factor [Calditrichota bacterium]